MLFGTHVLVVEDDESFRRTMARDMREHIERRGLPADLYESDRADLAFERILRNPGDRWFIVTDCILYPSSGPLKTGLDLIQRVYENVPRIRSYRILISGATIDPVDFGLFGVDRFFRKPCRITDLVDLLAGFLASE